MTVSFNQRGYVGSSMSVRAAEAYERGERPKSKWTKAAMIETFDHILKGGDVDEDLTAYTDSTPPSIEDTERAQIIAFLNSLPKKALFAAWMSRSSWHHTSKYANITDFYYPDLWGIGFAQRISREQRTSLLEGFKAYTRVRLNSAYSTWRMEGNPPISI